MKRRTVLAKQPVRKKRRRDALPLSQVIRRSGSILLKVSLLMSLIAVISLSFLWFYHYLLASPYLKLEEVEIEGVGRDLRNELIVRCGLNSEVSLIALNLNELKQKMEKHPWVRAVRLEREFPNALIVWAEKEQPCALVLMDKIYYMNRWGEIFKEVLDSEEIDFPVITGFLKKGSDVQEQLQRAALIIRVLESEKGLWSLNELSEINVKKEGGVSLYFNHLAAEIKLGCEDLRNKVDGLRRVAKHLSQTGRIHQVSGIDLNYVDEVVVSFRKG